MTNQEFKGKIKSYYCIIISIAFFSQLIYNTVTIAEDKELRVLEIDLGFYTTRFLQPKE